MDEVLFGLLTEHVDRYLDAADRRASADDARRLVAAWRALLDLHRPSGRRGACAGCAHPRTTMCGVWRVANAFFVRAG